MSNRFDFQYNILGLEPPTGKMSPADKAEVIFHASCKILGLDPTAIPQVHHLPEEFQVFPVAAFKLEVIRKAITEGRKADWNNTREYKWGSWFWMNNPGFRFDGTYCDFSYAGTTGGSRLCTFSEEDQDFFAIECIALWADFCGGALPE